MGQGPIDHPSYVTRQMLNVRGVANTQLQFSFPWDVRLRNMVATVQTVGTGVPKATCVALGTSIQYPPASQTLIYGTATSGTNTVTAVTTNTSTTTVGSIALTTATTLGLYGCTGDMNVKIPAGQQITLGFVTDTTIVFDYAIEYYIDPQSGNWTGQN